MTCLLCGREGADVRVNLVEVEHPDRTVGVKVPATHRDGAVEMTVTVPERYFATPRCQDRDACRERELLAEAVDVKPAIVAELVVEPVVDEVEDATSWL